MPTYAVLGATGNVGASLITVLSQSPDDEIHAYVRSRSKLLKKFPGLAEDPKVKVFDGNLDDSVLLADCISGTKAVFLAVAMNANQPGCTIAQQTARSVLEALRYLRKQDPRCQLPRLVALSSASLDHHLCRDLPKFAHNLLLMGASYVYADLREAEKLLRSNEDWVKTVFIKPGGLVHDKQKGHELSMDRQQTFVSYLDVAAGMVEVAARDDDYWDMKNVSVLPVAKDVKIEWMVPYYMVTGLLCHFFPWLYPYIVG